MASLDVCTVECYLTLMSATARLTTKRHPKYTPHAYYKVQNLLFRDLNFRHRFDENIDF